MRQAIVTAFLGPTNTRGARIKASCQAGAVTVAWDYALSDDMNHQAAACALASKFGWGDNLAGGALPSGRGCAFVFLK